MVTDKLLDPTTDEEVDLVKTIHYSEAPEIDSDDTLRHLWTKQGKVHGY